MNKYRCYRDYRAYRELGGGGIYVGDYRNSWDSYYSLIGVAPRKVDTEIKCLLFEAGTRGFSENMRDKTRGGFEFYGNTEELQFKFYGNTEK